MRLCCWVVLDCSNGGQISTSTNFFFDNPFLNRIKISDITCLFTIFRVLITVLRSLSISRSLHYRRLSPPAPSPSSPDLASPSPSMPGLPWSCVVCGWWCFHGVSLLPVRFQDRHVPCPTNRGRCDGGRGKSRRHVRGKRWLCLRRRHGKSGDWQRIRDRDRGHV